METPFPDRSTAGVSSMDDMETPFPDRSHTPDGYSSRPTSRGVPESPMPALNSSGRWYRPLDETESDARSGTETVSVSRPSTAGRVRMSPTPDAVARPSTAGRLRTSPSPDSAAHFG